MFVHGKSIMVSNTVILEEKNDNLQSQNITQSACVVYGLKKCLKQGNLEPFFPSLTPKQVKSKGSINQYRIVPKKVVE